jgi:hypothetical protein
VNTQTVYVFEELGATFVFHDPDTAAAARDSETKDGATNVSAVTKAEAPAQLSGDALAEWCASNVDNQVPEDQED